MNRLLVALALLTALLPALLASPVRAVEPDEILDNPALEARARDLSKELRCVVCQNQSIDDSRAGIARDLRVLVRERLVAGDSNTEVLHYVVARYGDYVLLSPPFKPATWALWVGPPVMIGALVMLIVMSYRRWKAEKSAHEVVDSLSPTDRAALDALVERVARNAPPPPQRSAFREEFEEPRSQPEATDATADQPEEESGDKPAPA